MVQIWKYLIETKIGIVVDSSTDDEDVAGVFLTENPMTSQDQRAWVCKTWFEDFSAASYFVAVGAVLGLYSTGRENGISIDSGEGTTHAVPIWDGYNLSSAVRRQPLSGSDLTDYMERLLVEDLANINLTSSAERMQVMYMKGHSDNQIP